MKQKILVTGISSPILISLVDKIDLSKYELVGISRHADSIPIGGVQVLEKDLLDFENCRGILTDCHMIIHGAAITHTRKEREYFKINLEVTRKILEAAQLYKVDRFIFISTNSAGLQSGAYGKSKFQAEEVIRRQFGEHLILRLSEVYGTERKNGIDKLIHELRHKRLIFYPTGSPSKFSPIHIDDCVEEMHRFIFDERVTSGTFTINGPEAFSYKDMIALTEGIYKRKIIGIPLSKNLMYLLRWLAKLTPFDIGLVPDQVDRLYARKEIEHHHKGLKLGTYLKEK